MTELVFLLSADIDIPRAGVMDNRQDPEAIIRRLT